MYIFLKISGFFLKLIPRRIGYFIFELFSEVLYYFNSEKRKNLKKNLSAVSGNENIPDKLLKQVFKNYARYYFDLFQNRENLITHFDKKKFDKGAEAIKYFLEKYGGCIIASIHIGNWDFGGAYLSYLFPGKINVVVEELSPAAFKWFKETREKWGMKVIKSTELKSMLKALKNKEVLVLLTDRDLEKSGFIINFFNKKAHIPSGPAKLALTARVPIMFAGLLRNQTNPLYFIPFFSEKFLNIDLLERNNENIDKITQELVSLMEEYIKENPEQWCMLQNIWSE